jgi:polyisoprenoid-binding protein YceI
MKLTVLSAAAAALVLVSCGPSAEEQAAAREKAVADSLAAAASKEMTFTIDPASSKVNWEGNMTGVKVYSHSGDLKLIGGSLMTRGNTLIGGEFKADLKSINPTDNGYSAEHPREGLIGHLSSADFFAVDSFPTAALTIVSVDGNMAKADLTLRGRTNSEKITDIVVTPNADGTVTATGKLVFDRKKYGATFPGPAKDMLLANDISLTVELTGKAQ